MHRMAQLGMVLGLLVWCGSPEPTVVDVGDLSAPPPQSLTDLATQVRTDGGLVFVGEPTGAATAVDPTYSAAPYGLRVAFPREQGPVHVVDALGATMDADVIVEGPAGPPFLVNEDGSPAVGYVMSQDGDPDAWQRQELPDSGSWLYFVMPHAGRFSVVWRAEVIDGTATGDGTIDGTDVATAGLTIRE